MPGIKGRTWKLSEEAKENHRKAALRYCSSPEGKQMLKNLLKAQKRGRAKNPLVRCGKNNPSWKGDEVGYRALHDWVKRRLGKAIRCKMCNKQGKRHEIHWANRTGKYKRDIKNWVSLCAKCHKKFDKKEVKKC